MSDVYVDAKGEVEKQVGEDAKKQIEGIESETISQDLAKERNEQRLQAYEGLFTRTSRRIYTYREQLKQRAAKLKTAPSTQTPAQPTPVTVDAKGDVERREGEKARKKIRTEQQQVVTETQNLEAAATYTGAQALAATGGFFEGATAPIRPYNIPRSIKAAGEIVTDPEKRAEVIRDIKTDPLKYGIGTPAAYIGGVTTGRVIAKAAKKLNLVEGKASAEFVEREITLEQKTSDWFHSKQVPKGSWSKHKSWGPPGEGGYIDTVLVPERITRRVLVPKVTYPTFSVQGGIVGISGFLGQQLKDPEKVTVLPDIKDVSTPKQWLKGRQKQTTPPFIKPVEIIEPEILPSVTPRERQRSTILPTIRERITPEQTQKQSDATIPMIVPISVQISKADQQLRLEAPRKTNKKKSKGKKKGVLEVRVSKFDFEFKEPKVKI